VTVTVTTHSHSSVPLSLFSPVPLPRSFLLHLEAYRYPVSLNTLLSTLHLLLLYECCPTAATGAYVRDAAAKQLRRDMQPGEWEDLEAALAARPPVDAGGGASASSAPPAPPGSALVAFLARRHLSNIQRVFVRILPLWKRLAAQPDAAKSAADDARILALMRQVAGGSGVTRPPAGPGSSTAGASAGSRREREDDEEEEEEDDDGGGGAAGSPPASARAAASAASSAASSKASRVTLSDASGQDEHFEKLGVIVRVCAERPGDVRAYSSADGGTTPHTLAELVDPRTPWPAQGRPRQQPYQQPHYQPPPQQQWGGGATTTTGRYGGGYRDDRGGGSYGYGAGSYGGGGYGGGGYGGGGGYSGCGGGYRGYDDRYGRPPHPPQPSYGGSSSGAGAVSADQLPEHYRRYSAPPAELAASVVRAGAARPGHILWFCAAEEWRRGGPKVSTRKRGMVEARQ
jgi:hypothetical protein